jgi:cation:H+ antiporter
MTTLLLLAGATLLYFGGEWLVGGATRLALSFRVPKLLIGLTVVAFGTSAPELVVGVEAAAAGPGAVALGNVIGSNIANIGLILGIATVIRPAAVAPVLKQRQVPILLLSWLAFPMLLLGKGPIPQQGLGLLLLALAYTAWMIHGARTAAPQASLDAANVTADAAMDAGAPAVHGRASSLAVAAAGLAALVVGGGLFVDGASSLARAFGVSERVVGLTVVAFGTSLPELATSVIAARRGHSDIVVGNVVGSNIFNILLCLGAATLAGGFDTSSAEVAFDLVILAAFTTALAILLTKVREIPRAAGVALLAGYVAYLAWLAAAGPTS